MKKSHQLILAAVAATGFAVSAQADQTGIVVDTSSGVLPYVVDARGVLVQSPFGLCYRTGFWSADLAKAIKTKAGKPVGCECDPGLMGDACTAPAATVPAATPAAAEQPAGAAPATAPAAPALTKVSLPSDALFDYDKAILSDLGKENLSTFAGNAKQLKQLEVIIAVGHADRIGSDKYNQALSEKRAAAVKDFLVGQGIAANKVYTEGKGEAQPVSGDACKKLGAESRKNKKLIDCLAPDRRVELEAVGMK